MNNQKSKCCGSSVTAISSDEGTSYYQCNRCLQPTDVVSTSKSEEKKTLQEWAKIQGYEILDPDGFDRSNPNLWTDLFTKEEFDKGFMGCTVGGIKSTKPRLENWEETFYESSWEPNTLTLSEIEEKWIEEVTRFLPRHMSPYDWNLPFAEMILLITRRTLISTLLQEERGKFINEIDETLKTVGDFSGEGFVSEDMKNFARIALNDLKVKMQQQ